MSRRWSASNKKESASESRGAPIHRLIALGGGLVGLVLDRLATRATAPGTRAVAAGPPVPRPRPGDVTGSVGSAPASSEPAAAPAAPAKTAPAAPAKPDVPPVVGFE
jgi:hypothetical protein